MPNDDSAEIIPYGPQRFGRLGISWYASEAVVRQVCLFKHRVVDEQRHAPRGASDTVAHLRLRMKECVVDAIVCSGQKSRQDEAHQGPYCERERLPRRQSNNPSHPGVQCEVSATLR